MTLQNSPIWSADLSLPAKILWLCYDKKSNFAGVSKELWDLLEEISQNAQTSSAYAAELKASGWFERKNGKLVAVIPGEQL